MRVVLVRTPDNGEYRNELTIFCSYAGLPVVVLGCIRSSCWQRGSNKDLKTTQADARTVRHSPKTNSKDVLQKMIFPRRYKGGDCLESSNLCSSSFGVERYSLRDGMRNWTPTQLSKHWPTICPAAGAMVVVTELVDMANQCLVELEAPDRRGSPCPTLLGWTGTKDWIVQRPRVEPNCNWSRNKWKNKTNALVPNDILLHS